MNLLHGFRRAIQVNEKQGEPKVIAVVLLILLGRKMRGRELRHGGICATD
jgi:hypothetical protein